MAVLFFWPADWLSTCCLKHILLASSDPLGLSPFSVFSLFNFLFTTLFSLHLCPHCNRCFCPTILYGGCKGAGPFAKEGAGGMPAGSGVRGSKCSQHNPSSSQRYWCWKPVEFCCLKNNLPGQDTWDTLLLAHRQNAREEGGELPLTGGFYPSPSARGQVLWSLVARAEAVCPVTQHDASPLHWTTPRCWAISAAPSLGCGEKPSPLDKMRVF